MGKYDDQAGKEQQRGSYDWCIVHHGRNNYAICQTHEATILLQQVFHSVGDKQINKACKSTHVN